MNRKKTLYAITFIVAFCSIVYELALGQALSLFLGNTILRFSVTIGIYMFAMGVGAMIAEGRMVRSPVLSFIVIECLLVFFGGLAPILFFLLNFLTGGSGVFVFVVHALIFLIGVLTGFEIPLLMKLNIERTAQKKLNNGDGRILGIDYLGAFLGSITFAIFCYPLLGLLKTTFFVGLLNSFVGIIFYWKWKGEGTEKEKKNTKRVFYVNIFLFVVLLGAFIFSANISSFIGESYLKS